MRRELLAIGLISLALFVLGNICTGLVMEAGNTQLDLTHAFIGRLSQARVLYFEPLPLSVGAACACARMARMGAMVGTARKLPQGRGAW